MGRPDKITPDIVEWLVGDEKVVSKWKSIAHRLNLDAYVDKIDENYDYKRKKFDRQKMKELMDVWRRASPITFTRSRLMDVLNKEGLSDMHNWLQLMETEDSPKKLEIAQLIDRSRQGTPRSTMSLSPQPPLYGSTPSSAAFRSLPSSPYSWYFESPQGGYQQQDHLHQSVTDNASALSIQREIKTLSMIKDTIRSPSVSLSSTMREHGILKKRDPDYQFLARTSDSNPSRESTPDSGLSRPISNGSFGSAKSGKTKTIRFADDLEVTSNCSDEQIKTNHFSQPTKPGFRHQEQPRKIEKGYSDLNGLLGINPRRGADQSVDKYFDNLISIIQQAADSL